MEKPISIIIDDAKKTIANAINETKLNPVILESIIKDIYIEVKQAAEMQIVQDRKQYKEFLKNDKEES